MSKNPGNQLAADLYARLDRYVRNRVSNSADAEDVLQDVFVKVLGGKGPNEAAKLLPWVFAVARNRIIDFYRERHRQRQRTDADRAGGGVGSANDEHPVDLQEAVAALMRLLSEQDQHALRAVDLKGMSQRDYADSLGLDYTTAKSRIQRARKRLRREFDRCCEIILDRRGAPIECMPRQKSACC